MIPNDFKTRMKNMLNENEYEAFMQSYEQPYFHALRINPLKCRIDNQIPNLSVSNLTPVDWCATGYYYNHDNSEFRPGKHPYHEAGVYYIQEPSAMAPAEYLNVTPGDTVLDLCAAPGGKSTQIAGKLNGRGLLISNEIISSRAKILSENIERTGIPNALVTNESSDRLANLFPDFFDKIMVDAPCSGEGMFRKNEEACTEWSMDNVLTCARRQAEILDNAAIMLKEGGRMVYSTCTFSPEENEGTIINFLLRHKNFHLVKVTKTEGMSDGKIDFAEQCVDSDNKNNISPETLNPILNTIPYTIRMMPHKMNGEGHFIAVFQKEFSDNPSAKADKNSKSNIIKGVNDKSIKEYLAFCEQFLKNRPQGIHILFGDHLYVVPDNCPPLDKIKVLRPGLHLGTFLKNRFEPSHSLALALSANDVQNVLNLSSHSEEIYKYINGETLNCTGEKGWYLITVDGYSIGFGKLSGDIMKNHYPKGLRKNLR